MRKCNKTIGEKLFPSHVQLFAIKLSMQSNTVSNTPEILHMISDLSH